jgi:hypothetical protein
MLQLGDYLMLDSYYLIFLAGEVGDTSSCVAESVEYVLAIIDELIVLIIW